MLDFDFSCVTHAVQDLAFMVANMHEHSESERASEYRRVFLTSYLAELGQSLKQLDELEVDVELAHLGSWTSGGQLAPWNMQVCRLSEFHI